MRKPGFQIEHDSERKTVVMADSGRDLVIGLKYDHQCILDRVTVRGVETVYPAGKVYGGIRLEDTLFSTITLDSSPTVEQHENSVIVTGIQFGEEDRRIREEWSFTVFDNRIDWKIVRAYSFGGEAEEVLFPLWNFDRFSVWNSALLGNGGVAWFALFDSDNATYGVHADKATFWNSAANACFRITLHPNELLHSALRFSRESNGTLTCCCSATETELQPRHDQGLHRRRYLTSRQDVWSPLPISAGSISVHLTLQAFDFDVAYPRGTMPSIDCEAVKGVLNTVARVGVIDAKLIGSNSWRTPFGPICLHEQFVAQMGLALDDPDYLEAYRDCLDFFRDHAIGPDGRVKARWAYTCEDAIPGTCDPRGFYEAQWGYLLDSNPDFVTNVAELFDLNGDFAWLKTHKRTCERAIEYMLNRDTDQDGLVEMMTDDHLQQRGSDWMDVIWAAHKNAFVNAKMFHALTLWSTAEDVLADHDKAGQYRSFAAQLKEAFNRSTSEGGFWDSKNEWYVHWRDKDGSIHGNNLVLPVNFMAIAYGICDDLRRRKPILDRIEEEMQREKLFAWPVCMYSYAPGEGMEFQFPFPNYENGDIFLAWVQLGVQSYALYKPEVALRYILNVLAQYKRDGLTFQRYSRKTQEGLGDDILANNALAVVGLYRDIYGVRPKHDRLYLEPHIVPELNGTKLQYLLRNQNYRIDLKENLYGAAVENFSVLSPHPFALRLMNDEIHYFFGNESSASLSVKSLNGTGVELKIVSWSADGEKKWIERAQDRSATLDHALKNLKPGVQYVVRCDSQEILAAKSDNNGTLRFIHESYGQPRTFYAHEAHR